MAEDTLAKCLADFEEDLKPHDAWALKVDRWYRAWRGIQEARERGEYRAKLSPPYLLQVIETLCAGLIDPNPKWPVKPRARLTTMDELQATEQGAKALEQLLAYQRDVDMMTLKQRPHRLQGLIAGLTVWKPYWEYSDIPSVKTHGVYTVDEYGNPQEAQHEVEGWEIVKDDPCVDVVDVRDWIWHQAATKVETAKRITHRVWKTYEQLEELQADGYYENVAELKESRSFSEQLASRESTLFEQDRTKDMIEVLECWIEGGKRVVTIANRTVILRDKPNPFNHQQYPFIACAPIPDLFRIPGVSVVELVDDLQRMLWQIQNQRLDNLEMINNAVVLIRDDVVNKDEFVFAPGEQWLVPDKEAASLLEMPTFPAQISLEAENLIKADIQNIPGASPALLGQSDATTQTATEVSLLTNLAQRRLAAQKYQFTVADTRVAEQWIELNRQFLNEQRYVGIIGEDGEEGWELIHPDTFKDYRWKVDVEEMDESLVRQERTAEAQSRLQVAVQVAPVFAAVGTPLNLKQFMDDALDAAGVQGTERYYSAQAQPQPPGQGQAAPPPQGPAPTPEGVSAPQATDANSPSNMFSQSPVAAMQRMLAGAGGPSNAPGG